MSCEENLKRREVCTRFKNQTWLTITTHTRENPAPAAGEEGRDTEGSEAQRYRRIKGLQFDGRDEIEQNQGKRQDLV
jgi:hypothetical protein